MLSPHFGPSNQFVKSLRERDHDVGVSKRYRLQMCKIAIKYKEIFIYIQKSPPNRLLIKIYHDDYRYYITISIGRNEYLKIRDLSDRKSVHI